MATRKSNRSKSSKAPARDAQRTKVVWGTLLASLTVVAGVLYVVNGAGKGDGIALMSVAPKPGSIFETPAALNGWNRIVIIDNSSPFGNVETLTKRAAELGETSGIGVHFVVGNGRSLDDGKAYRLDRWDQQAPASPAYGSDLSDGKTIVICLVGNTERSRVTDAQFQNTATLTARLAARFGIPASRVELRVGAGLNRAAFLQAIGG